MLAETVRHRTDDIDALVLELNAVATIVTLSEEQLALGVPVDVATSELRIAANKATDAALRVQTVMESEGNA
ncbi:MAG: hypothetical protein QOD92_3640 [Acidimicrobiaceae bacterium]